MIEQKLAQHNGWKNRRKRPQENAQEADTETHLFAYSGNTKLGDKIKYTRDLQGKSQEEGGVTQHYETAKMSLSFFSVGHLLLGMGLTPKSGLFPH